MNGVLQNVRRYDSDIILNENRLQNLDYRNMKTAAWENTWPYTSLQNQSAAMSALKVTYPQGGICITNDFSEFCLILALTVCLFSSYFEIVLSVLNTFKPGMVIILIIKQAKRKKA